MLVFGRRPSCSGTTVPQLFPNHFPLFPNIPTFPHITYLWNTSTENGCYVQVIANMTRTRVSMKNRLLSIVEKRTVVRARDLYRSGIHPEALSRALRRGLFLKIGRGLYARKDFSADFERQIMLACKRVPNGIVCLKSAVRFHGLVPLDSASIWMAIDVKAKKPVAGGLRLRFVRFSGQALTQGVDNCCACRSRLFARKSGSL